MSDELDLASEREEIARRSAMVTSRKPEGQRRYLRAVYALGSKPDKPRPEYKPRLLAAKRRYWAARKQRLFVAQVCAIVQP